MVKLHLITFVNFTLKTIGKNTEKQRIFLEMKRMIIHLKLSHTKTNRKKWSLKAKPHCIKYCKPFIIVNTLAQFTKENQRVYIIHKCGIVTNLLGFHEIRVKTGSVRNRKVGLGNLKKKGQKTCAVNYLGCVWESVCTLSNGGF